MQICKGAEIRYKFDKNITNLRCVDTLLETTKLVRAAAQSSLASKSGRAGWLVVDAGGVPPPNPPLPDLKPSDPKITDLKPSLT